MRYRITIPKVNSNFRDLSIEYNENGIDHIDKLLIPPDISQMEIDIKDGFEYIYDTNKKNTFNVIFNYTSNNKSGIVQLVPHLLS